MPYSPCIASLSGDAVYTQGNNKKSTSADKYNSRSPYHERGAVWTACLHDALSATRSRSSLGIARGKHLMTEQSLERVPPSSPSPR